MEEAILFASRGEARGGEGSEEENVHLRIDQTNQVHDEREGQDDSKEQKSGGNLQAQEGQSHDHERAAGGMKYPPPGLQALSPVDRV